MTKNPTRRFRHRAPCILVFAVTEMVGCSMDDADRCTGTYVWSEAEAACLPPDEPEAEDTTPEQPGLGDPCWDDTDCADAGAYDVCLRDPTNDDVEGMCTFAGCTAVECGGRFQCCDCTAVSFPPWETPYCVDETSAALLASICSCDREAP